MKLINGRFYDGDHVIPLEFGNQEQIKLIKEKERLMDEGLILDIDYEVKAIEASSCFRCFKCDSNIYLEEECQIEGDKVFMDRRIRCKCGVDYEVYIEDGDHVVKIKKGP